MKEHEAIERLFILSQPGVATESGIKIEPIAVNLWSVSPRGKQREREIQRQREREKEREGYNSHEVSVSFLSEEKGSPGKEKVLRRRLADCLHWASISLSPSVTVLSTTHPNGSVMTSSGVNREACRGLIQSEGLCGAEGAGGSDRCQRFNYQPSCLFSNTPLKPPPRPIPFSFITASPARPGPATIFVWLRLLPSLCSQQKPWRECWSVWGTEMWQGQSVNPVRQLSFIVPF